MHVPIREFLSPTKVRITQLFEWDEWLDVLYSRLSPIQDFPLVNQTPYPPAFVGWPLT